MARQKREGASKHTLRIDDALMAKLRRIAGKESRTATAQIEHALQEWVRQYEKAEGEKSEGQFRPKILRAA